MISEEGGAIAARCAAVERQIYTREKKYMCYVLTENINGFAGAKLIKTYAASDLDPQIHVFK